MVDARDETIRRGGSFLSCKLLTAIGFRTAGRRTTLGCSVEPREADAYWLRFLESLRPLGIRGPELVVSGEHSGLRAARDAVFPDALSLRCQLHVIQSAITHVPRVTMRADVAADLRRVFDADDAAEANRQLRDVAARYRKPAPALAAWLSESIPEALAVLQIPAAQRRPLRTTNGLDRLDKEIKRRTMVATLFPNEALLLGLTSAVLSEISNECQTERAYPTMGAR